MFMKLSRTLIAAGLVLGTCQVQAAPTYIFTTPDFALPSFAGNGLLGSVWSQVPIPPSLADRNLAWATNYMGTHTPGAAFVSTAVDYPQGASEVLDDSATIAAFLGADAASLTTASVGADPVLGTLLRLTGYYRVDAAGSVFFNVGSDDGVQVWIHGSPIAALDGIHSFDTTGPIEIGFTTPGLYALRIDWFDAEPTEGGLLLGTGTPITSIAQNLLYRSPIPEPASMSLFGIGLLALLLQRQKGPQRANPAALAAAGL